MPETNPFELLIVDDNKINLEVVGTMIKSKNIRSTFATNGKDALKKIKEKAFDLILLDIMMPEMDGFEVCEILQNDESTRHIPIIFLTAKNNTEDIVKGLELGGVDYIVKPFNPKELKKRILTHLNLKRAQDRVDLQNKLLAQQNEELQELNHTKDKLFSIIAHDLKNPFNTIAAYSELITRNLERKRLNKVSNYNQQIHNMALQGFDLLVNLLEWSRLQSNRLIFEPVLCDIVPLITDTIKLINANAENKDIRFVHDFPDTLPCYCDDNMIRTVLRNLLSNAVKFTPDGGTVTIQAKLTGNGIEVKVEDTGVGMTEEEQKQLFRLDKHFTKEGTANEKGSGLGLILCKDFVEQHGGQIRLTSEKGQGSCFAFSIPKQK